MDLEIPEFELGTFRLETGRSTTELTLPGNTAHPWQEGKFTTKTSNGWLGMQIWKQNNF